jgi:transposase
VGPGASQPAADRGRHRYRSAVLAAAGDNPQRLGTEAAFALLCGVAPPWPPGKTPGIGCTGRQPGRQPGVVGGRAGTHVRDQRTRAYVARRTAEGKTTPEIIRCLKRFLARELYQLLSTAAPSNHCAAVA